MRPSEFPDWQQKTTENKLVYLRGAFTSGEIKHFTIPELEEFLVVLTNALPAFDTGRLMYAVRLLLEARLAESLQISISTLIADTKAVKLLTGVLVALTIVLVVLTAYLLKRA